MIEAKRVPYGVSDFLRVIRENQYYVDKTMYIPLLEAQPDNLIFIRPRRFGKSLFLSMLEAYYDCKLKDQFQEIFGGLWIGSQPTPLQGKYQVLTLDFSQVGGNIDNLEASIHIAISALTLSSTDMHNSMMKQPERLFLQRM